MKVATNRIASSTLFTCSALLAVLVLGLSACSSVTYLSQALVGQVRIMHGRAPIEEVLKRDDVSTETKDKLRLVLEVRAYAAERLGLPRNRSYTLYKEVKGQYLGWNVYVAPEFSVEPVTWCFPIAGCVVYRGFFSKEKAVQFARKMEGKGYDVFVGPFSAYSTLGWVDDPILSSQLALDPIRLAGLVIHELAHQKYYVPGDSRFNEGFAVAVERAGVLQWLRSTGRDDMIVRALAMWEQEDRRASDFLKARSVLRELYLSGADSKSLLMKKAAIFQDLGAEPCREGDGGKALPRTGSREVKVNNAYLVPIDTYYALVPFFKSVLDSVGGSLPRFYERVEELGKLPKEQRQRTIKSLQRDLETSPQTKVQRQGRKGV